MKGASYGKTGFNPLASSGGSAYGTRKSGKLGASGVNFNP